MQASEYRKLYDLELDLWWFRALRKFIFGLLPAPLTDLRVLDIGCGTGGLLASFQLAGSRPIGLDYSQEGVSLAKERNSIVVRGSANELPFAMSFDRITCVDVLEVSTVKPAKLVRSAVSVLKPGSYGLFIMAAHGWLMSDHDRAVDSVRRFNLGQLKQLFAGEDVRIVRSTYLFMATFPLLVVRKLLNRNRSAEIPESDVRAPSALINQILYGLCSLEATLLPYISLPVGSSVAVLVRKND
jgi:SAM-dependent methyltransferase